MKTAFCGATLIDGTGKPPVENGVILIEDGVIRNVGKSIEIALPIDCKRYDLKGKTIIPGLIDCHIHMDLHGLANTNEENYVEEKLRSIRTAYDMEETLKQGITTVRNAGSVNGIDFAVKSAVDAGWCKGPRIITSGQIISMTARGNDYFKGMYREADGKEEVLKATREQIKAGADFIKVMATGAYMNPGGEPGAVQFNLDELIIIVEEAKKLGLHVAAHAHGAQGILNACIAGVKTIEHASFINEQGIKMAIEKGIYIVPTLAAGFNVLKNASASNVPRFMVEKMMNLRETRINNIKKAFQAGVKIAFGSDAGTSNNSHGQNALELIIWVKENIMNPLEAIYCATKVAAEALGIEDKVGTIESGKVADMVVINGELTDSLQPLIDQIQNVYKDGKEIPLFS
jgi:imidazolonepropionase-like amidohydrolase